MTIPLSQVFRWKSCQLSATKLTNGPSLYLLPSLIFKWKRWSFFLKIQFLSLLYIRPLPPHSGIAFGELLLPTPLFIFTFLSLLTYPVHIYILFLCHLKKQKQTYLWPHIPFHHCPISVLSLTTKPTEMVSRVTSTYSHLLFTPQTQFSSLSGISLIFPPKSYLTLFVADLMEMLYAVYDLVISVDCWPVLLYRNSLFSWLPWYHALLFFFSHGDAYYLSLLWKSLKYWWSSSFLPKALHSSSSPETYWHYCSSIFQAIDHDLSSSLLSPALRVTFMSKGSKWLPLAVTQALVLA